MKTKKRILILTSDAGFGHRSAATALADIFNEIHGGECECVILNPMGDKNTPSFIRNSQSNYDHMVRSNPDLYWMSYASSDQALSRPIVEGTLSLLLRKTLQAMIMEYQPDVIVSTYLIYNAPLLSTLKNMKRSIPLFTVITEWQSIHKSWYQGHPQKIFVASEVIRQEAIAYGVNANKVLVSGIPVNPAISKEKRQKKDIRAELGWQKEIVTLLAVGSRRVKHLVETVQEINESQLPIQLIIVAGGDMDLYQQLKTIQWSLPVYLYNFVDQMPMMLHAADMVMTKAGGLIISESLACGLPMLLIDLIQGQETGNADFVSQQGAGAIVKTPAEMIITLNNWLSNDQKELEEFSSRACLLGKPHAANTIADEIWKTLLEINK